MNIDTLPLLVLLALCLIMGISLVIVIQDLFRMEKKLQKSEEENQAFKNSLQHEADVIIDDAHKQAMHVLDEANHKAMAIVSTSEDFSSDAKQTMKQNLDTLTQAETAELTQIGEQMRKAYEQTIQSVRHEGDQMVQNITKDIENKTTAQITEFTDAVKKETVESERLIEARINSEFEAARHEVEAYKQAQLQKVQEHIIDLVRMLTEAALGKGLTIEQHQTLVMEALEEAKAQGVIK